MRERFPAVYERAPLSAFTFGERLKIRFADLAFYFLIKVICSTLRYEAEDEQNFNSIIEAGHQPIYTFWHDRIFAGVYYFRNRGIVVMTSKSLDGEYIARFITRFGYGAARGSSSRGGVRGLVELIRLMKAGLPAAFTVDGPRGPRYTAKSGPVMLAKKSGHPVMPFVVECRSYWTIKSWDRLQIPKPFTRARVFYGAPIYVPDEGGDEIVETKRAELQQALDSLVERGERWRHRLVEFRTP